MHLKEPYAPWVVFLTKYMGIWPKGSREKLRRRAFQLHPAGRRHRPGHVRGVAAERIRQPQAQSELLAKGPAALGAAGGEDRAGGRDARCLSAERPGRHHRRAAAAGVRAAEDPARACRRVSARPSAAGASCCSNTQQAAVRRHQIPPGGRLRRSTARRIAKEDLLRPGRARHRAGARLGAGGTTSRPTTSSRYDLDKARAYLAKSKYPNGAEFDVSVPRRALSARHARTPPSSFRRSSRKLEIKLNIKLARAQRRRRAAYIRGELSGTIGQHHVARRADLPDHGQLHAGPGHVEGPRTIRTRASTSC